MGDSSADIIPGALVPLLRATEEDPRPVVVMMCGIAGSGKSTLSKSIVESFPNFARVSIDVLVHSAHGLYGIDYPHALHEQYQSEADDKYKPEVCRLLCSTPPTNVVLDRSFYARSDRDEFRLLAQDMGARCVLVYFDASREALWQRIQKRATMARSADSAFKMTEEILDRYVRGFEYPRNEGEIVIRVS